MDENTVFPQKPVIQQGQSAEAQPIQTAPAGYPPAAKRGSIPGKVSKLMISLLVLLIVGGIGYAVITFVVPNFFSAKNETVTLTYWGLFEGENTMRVVINEFERLNPTIKVNYKKEDLKDYRERLTTRINNGTGPDIYRIHNTWLPMFTDLLSPVPNSTITKEELQKQYYPVVLSDLVKNGALYAVPLEVDTLALFVNTDILKPSGLQVPSTWDDFINTARSLTVKDEDGKIKTAGAALGTFDNIAHAPDIVSLLFVQNGADVADLASTSKNAADALSYYVSFAKNEEGVWDETLDPSMLAFSKGSLAMYFGYSWDIFIIKAANPDLNFSVHPVPRLPGRSMTIASYWAEGVSIKSKHQKEAMAFLAFLARKETQQKLFTEESKTRLFGEPYSRSDLADTLKNNLYLYPFVSQANNAKSSFFAGDTFDNGLNSQMNTYLGNAVRSILGNTSAESAVETLSQGVAQVLQQYGAR